MKRVLISLVIGIFILSFIAAQGANNSEMNGVGPEGTPPALTNMQNQQRVRVGNYTGANGTKIRIQQQNENRLRLEVGGVGADCECNLTQEQIQNRTRLNAMLSNGRNAEIKVMPDTASETALQRLRLKNCSGENNCSIELREVGQGNQIRLAYEMNIQRQSRVFGLFQARMQVQARIDAETGEVIGVSKPWWAFLASEPSEE